MTFYQKLHFFIAVHWMGLRSSLHFHSLQMLSFKGKKKKKNQHIKAKAKKLKQNSQLDSFSNSLK